MWKELVERLAADSPFGNIREFLAPTTLDVIRQAEGELSITFPSDLRKLLLEANGIWGPSGALIWPVERIVKDNMEFRSLPEFRTLYMPFDHLLFFADDGSGDQFAFRIFGGAVSDRGVFRWNHENDAREWAGGDMRDYLARALGFDSFFSTLR